MTSQISKMACRPNLAELPTEVLTKIFQSLDSETCADSLFALKFTCKRFKKIIEDFGLGYFDRTFLVTNMIQPRFRQRCLFRGHILNKELTLRLMYQRNISENWTKSLYSDAIYFHNFDPYAPRVRTILQLTDKNLWWSQGPVIVCYQRSNGYFGYYNEMCLRWVTPPTTSFTNVSDFVVKNDMLVAGYENGCFVATPVLGVSRFREPAAQGMQHTVNRFVQGFTPLYDLRYRTATPTSSQAAVPSFPYQSPKTNSVDVYGNMAAAVFYNSKISLRTIVQNFYTRPDVDYFLPYDEVPMNVTFCPDGTRLALHVRHRHFLRPVSSLRIWDLSVDGATVITHPLDRHNVSHCNATLTSIRWESTNLLWTSSAEAVLQRWDLRVNCPVQKIVDVYRRRIPCFETDYQNTIITGCGNEPRALLWDVRRSSTCIQEYVMYSENDEDRRRQIDTLQFDESFLFTATRTNIFSRAFC